MLSTLSVVVVAFAALGSCAAFKSQPRAVAQNQVLYAYGAGIGGAPVFFGDGLAFIGNLTANGSPSNIAVASDITIDIDSDDSTVPWNVTSTSGAFNSTRQLYIDVSAGANAQVGFLDTNSEKLPTNATTTGFTLLGSEVFFIASEIDYQNKFWATPTSLNGSVFALSWNVAGVASNGSLPVVLKTTAPIVTRK